SRRLRRASRRVKAAELTRQQFSSKQQAQDMALAVAERARSNLQERADRVPELERSIARLEEALERAEDELRSPRGGSRPLEAPSVRVPEHDGGYADLRELITALASDQRRLHAEIANLVGVFAAHFTAMGRALAEKDIAEKDSGEPK